MPDFVDRFFDPKKLDQYWGQAEPPQLKDSPPLTPADTALQILQDLRQCIHNQFGKQAHVICVLIEQARELIMQDGLATNREKIIELFDQIEELVDTLYVFR